MESVDFKKELNAEQLAAATAPDGPALVLAAAGTGKTRTLVYRVAYLVGQGVEPSRILLLTFTNRAAREMLERAEDVVHGGVSGILGGTFHHLANRVLRRHGSATTFGSDYTILDRDDSRSLVKEVLKSLNLNNKEFPNADVLLGLFCAAVNTETPLATVVERRLPDASVAPEDVVRVHKGYEARKGKLCSLDFDDLLVHCLRLFKANEGIAARYQEQFRHVLVDEYQDTNTIQAELVDILAAANRNILVVGDDFQSIYSWRGANFQNIMSFPERYPDAVIYRLETNYRSVPEVLNVANACIAGNPDQYQKTLRATRPAYRRPVVFRVRDGDEQSRAVVDQIVRLRRDGHRLSDIAVLYRAHFHAMELQMMLTREQMPYTITSGVRFFEQAHVKDACSVLRLLANPGDELAFLRLIGLLPGVGPRTAAKVWEGLGQWFDPRDEQHVAAVAGALSGRCRPAWRDMALAFRVHEEEDEITQAGTVLDAFVRGFYAGHADNTYENASSRKDDIDELCLAVSKAESLTGFLSDIALLSNLDAEAENAGADGPDSLRLSTVHQAKGLEWSAVILLWLVEGMFPSSRAVNESAGGEAEERRLFYVAVTRAKDELCLCVPEVRRKRDGGVIYCTPSRFVTELHGGLVEEVRGTFI